MKYNKFKLYSFGSILLIGFLLISMTHANGIVTNQATLETNYLPNLDDSFMYIGDNEQIEIQFMERSASNSTTGELIDYYNQFVEQLSHEQINNAYIKIDGMDESVFGANIAVSGVQNIAGSFFKNDTNTFNINDGYWNNQSVLENMNETPYNQEIPYKFSYSSGTVPSSMIMGDNMEVYIGMESIPIGGNSGNSGCAPEDLTPYTIQNGGEIQLPLYYPFDNLSEFQLRGIFNATTFDWSSFKGNNQEYINTHTADNITWTMVDLGLISGINPVNDGVNVVLVYQLAENFRTGMLEAADSYCATSSDNGGSPFDLFGDFSHVPLTWSELNNPNKQMGINGNNYNLATKTYQGMNDTVAGIQVNMSLGDDPSSSFYAMVNVMLQVHVGIFFEYDIATGFMVDYKSDLSIFLGMNADNIEAPLGDSGYNGTLAINSTMSMANHMHLSLAKHSSLYQITSPSQTTTTDTNTTSTDQTNSTTTTSQPTQSIITTITADFPTFIIFLALPVLILFRKKR